MWERLSDLICGTLLHDVGKVVYRASVGKGNHSERGAQFLDEIGISSKIISLCRYHHKSDLKASNSRSADHLILCESDWLSSAERPEKEEKEGRWESYIPLLNPFSKLSLNHSAEKPCYTGAWTFFPIRPLQGENEFFFPSRDPLLGNEESYRKLLDGLRDGLKSIPLNPDLLLPLLERYLSFVPSETRIAPPIEGREVKVGNFTADPARMPDISLFDHLKTTAAIASSMFLYMMERGDKDFEEGDSSWEVICRRDEPRYLLVGGDISGVQRFIYTISSKGALKGLRARSFWLDMLSEHITFLITEPLHLSRANVIFCGGGHFLILLPNTQKARERIEEVRSYVNGWLHEKHGFKLYLALSYVPFCGVVFLSSWWRWRKKSGEIPKLLRDEVVETFNQCDSCKFAVGDKCTLLGEVEGRPITIPTVFRRLGRLLSEEKGRKFAGLLDFEPREAKRGRCRHGCEEIPFECQICHMEGVKVFEHANLPDAEPVHACPFCYRLWELGRSLPRIRFIARFPEGKEISDNSIVKFDLPGALYIASSNKEKAEEFGKPEALFLLNSFKPGLLSLQVANYIVDPEISPDFKELSERTVGAERLAVLRADVDNLGKLISSGIFRGEHTFSRMASVSRFLNLFFKLGINHICSGKEVAVVYSGGDDLFIVGAYNDVLKLAFDVRRSFMEFAGDNPDVTLSGGVVVFQEGHPIHLVAEIAYEAEDEAKEYESDGKKKNAISLLYNLISNRESRTFSWDEAERLANMVEFFVREFGSKEERTLRLHKIPRILLFKMLDIAEFWEKEGKLYLPHVVWLVTRTKPPEEKAWERFKKWLLDPENARYFRAFATWLILLTRGGETG